MVAPASPLKSSADVIVVMGVAGSGKTTIGEELARRLEYKFADADSFHSPENKQKMAGGHPLTDEDRQPWLESMRRAINSWLQNGDHYILACSALKQAYRDVLDVDETRVLFIFLQVDRDELAKRLQARQHHYMKAGMLESQLETLEPPGQCEALIVDGNKEPDEIIQSIVAQLPAVRSGTLMHS